MTLERNIRKPPQVSPDDQKAMENKKNRNREDRTITEKDVLLVLVLGCLGASMHDVLFNLVAIVSSLVTAKFLLHDNFVPLAKRSNEIMKALDTWKPPRSFSLPPELDICRGALYMLVVWYRFSCLVVWYIVLLLWSLYSRRMV